MKTTLTHFLIYLTAAITLLAETPQAERGPDGSAREARMLGHLLQMQPEELSALRTTIERIENMSPEEKALLRQKIQKLDRMPPEKARAMHERFKKIDPEVRKNMRKRWLEMAPEARREWRQKLRDMSPEERAEVFEKEGFLPKPPGPPHGGPKPPKPSME